MQRVSVNPGKGSDNCSRNANCTKLNRHVIASSLLVRQLLARNGMTVPPGP